MVYSLILVILSISAHAAFFKEQAAGWHWYQHPVIEEPKSPVTAKASPTQIINAYKEQLEKKLHLALVQPTINNIKAYQELQRDLMQRSQHFAHKWMQVIYEHPQLDHTLVAPVNQKARHIYLDAEKQLIATTITELKEQYGLFFFFSGACQYCHEFAPIVKEFSAKYGWQVVAISVDGGKVAEFKEAVVDHGLVTKWQIPRLPALLAVNPRTEQILPLAFGLTTLAELETRVMALIKERQL